MTRSDPVSIRLAVALYRAFAVLLPSGLREVHGADLLADFRRLARRSHERGGAAGVLGAAVRGGVDVVLRVPIEHWRERESALRAGEDPLSLHPRGPRRRAGVYEMMRLWLKELHRAARTLARRPGFTLVVVLTLGLGIGANVAIFAVVNAVLVRPLPYPGSDRIVAIEHHAPGLNLPQLENSEGTIRLYRTWARTIAPVAGVRERQRNLVGGDRPARVGVLDVTPEFFDVVRTEPIIGRRFGEDDAVPGAAPVTILTHAGWQAYFGGDRGIVGRVVEFDGTRTEVVGVLPEGFHYGGPDRVALLPGWIDPAGAFGSFGMVGIARLAPGVTLEDARREVEALQPRLMELFPDLPQDFLRSAQWSAGVVPLRDRLVRDVETALWVILGTVVFVLLIACANVANLFLVRAEGRKREAAIRSALGATGGKLAGSFLAESVLLGLAGGVVGMALATAGVRALVASEAAALPRLHEVAIDGATLLFAAVISLAAGLAFGALPLPRLLRGSFGAALREGRSETGSRERHRTRKILIAGQVALALVLLTGSGLMIRSFQRLRAVDPGIRAEGVLAVGISLGNVESAAAAAALYQRAIDEVAALPGVAAAGATNGLALLGGSAVGSSFDIESRPRPEDAIPPVAMYGAVTPGVFESLGIPLRAGRGVERRDHETAAPVAWVNETLARNFLDGDAIGERIRFDPNSPWLEIVGVVGDVRSFGLAEEVRPLVYLPMTTPAAGVDLGLMHLTVRTAGDPLALVAPIRRAVERAAPNVPLTTARTMESIMAESVAETSFTMVVLGIAALVALLLGAVGLYGVISYVASQRTREIGLRMALGALPGQVRTMMLRQGMAVVAVGVGIGLVAALGLTRLMASILFEVPATDPLTFGVAVLVLTAVSGLASYLPARRASAIEPTEALRVE